MAPGRELVLVTGRPGAGKSTVVRAITARYEDVARFAVRDFGYHLWKLGHPLGVAIRGTLDRYELIEDIDVKAEFEIFLDSLGESTRTVLVESYPRSASQCDALAETLVSGRASIAALVIIDVPASIAASRIARRRLCRDCGASTATDSEVCRRCGGPLYYRLDDSPDSARTRLSDFDEIHWEVVDRFAASGLLLRIDGNRPISIVLEEFERAVFG